LQLARSRADANVAGMSGQVCIVGGGPAGLLLARRGADVTVLEAHDTFDREFRGEILQPSTSRLLDALGLLPYILAQPHSLLRRGHIRLGGRLAGTFEFSRIAPEYPYAIWMPQPVFLGALRAKAESLPNFRLLMGAKVTALHEEHGKVCGVRALHQGRELEIPAEAVAGADGRFSRLRRNGGFDLAYAHHELDIAWFAIERPADWPDALTIALGQDVRGLILPKHPRHLQAGISLRAGQWRQWRDQGLEFVRGRVRAFDSVFAPFAEGLRDFSEFVLLEGRIELVRRWARDGLVLIGDAAHTMSPAGAVGVNVALATAAVAAQVIHPALGRGPVPAGVLDAIQRIREPDVRLIHRLQRRAQGLLLPPERETWRTRAAQRLLPLFLRTPLLPRLQRRVFFGTPLPPLDPAFSLDKN